jgi:Dockerin type I domain
MSVASSLCRSFLALAIACAPLYPQASDVTAPTLLSFSFRPSSIDTRFGPQNITFTADVADDLSGVGYVSVQLSNTSNQLHTIALSRTTSTPLSVTYTATYPFPQFTASGDWQVSVRTNDVVGNTATSTTATLQARGFPASLTVVSTPDTTPPQIESLQFQPLPLNTSAGPVNMTMRMRVTDVLAGFIVEGTTTPWQVTLTSPSGNQLLRLRPSEFRLVSGTFNDGVWEAPFVMRKYSEPGVWRVVYIRLDDKVNNFIYETADSLAAGGLQPHFSVSSDPADTVLPALTSLTLKPLMIDTSQGSQTVTITLGLEDNLSGIDFDREPVCPCTIRGIVFRSPSGNQTRYSELALPQVSGTMLNGTWIGTAVFPRYSEAGTWNAQVYLKDRARNERYYTTGELKAAGFPESLAVIRPSYVPDKTIGSAGGTITDQIFGSLAQLSIPSGALTGPTSISIDVLQNPRNIAVPQGFNSPVTHFVNIDLNPHPSSPIGPPGYTLTIPLGNPQPAGTSLELFRLDPITGNLVRARGVSASPVKGTVDSSGQSATFTGISSFSTVVGLPASTPKPGDVNSDGIVDCADLSIVRAAFGKRSGQPNFDTRADTNRDGIVNISDLSYVLQQLPAGSSCP